MANTPWMLRCLPALSTIFLLFLWLFAFSRSIWSLILAVYGYSAPLEGPHLSHAENWSASELLLALYTFFLHVLAMQFTLRSCWAIVLMTSEIIRARIQCAVSRRESKLTIAGQRDGTKDHVVHCVILPNYKEDMDTLRETLEVLASGLAASDHMDVWLAMEEADPDATSTASALIDEFNRQFRSINFTIHPSNITDEARGKSSNVSWAAKNACAFYDLEKRDPNERVIVTVIDADTHLSPDYFSIIAQMHQSSTAVQKDITLYCPPTVFDRNSHEVPGPIRTADTMWNAATLSGTFPGSPLCIPTSCYSVPLSLVNAVGGWDTGNDAIGEDMHMFLKCYYHTRGKLLARAVPSPASQCNVDSQLKGVRRFFDAANARWKQGLRHMWGSLDTGYAICRTLDLLRSGISRRDLSFQQLFRTFQLHLRLFEAHCLPLQIVLSAIGSGIIQLFLPPVLIPTPLRLAFTLCDILRAASFIVMLAFFFLYKRFLAVAYASRMDDRRSSGLETESCRPPLDGWRYWADLVAFPISGMCFGTAPAAVAQFSHLGTTRLDYVVSAKPMKMMQALSSRLTDV